jgi:hypothetical protein
MEPSGTTGSTSTTSQPKFRSYGARFRSGIQNCYRTPLDTGQSSSRALHGNHRHSRTGPRQKKFPCPGVRPTRHPPPQTRKRVQVWHFPQSRQVSHGTGQAPGSSYRSRVQRMARSRILPIRNSGSGQTAGITLPGDRHRHPVTGTAPAVERCDEPAGIRKVRGPVAFHGLQQVECSPAVNRPSETPSLSAGIIFFAFRYRSVSARVTSVRPAGAWRTPRSPARTGPASTGRKRRAPRFRARSTRAPISPWFLLHERHPTPLSTPLSCNGQMPQWPGRMIRGNPEPSGSCRCAVQRDARVL